MNLTVPCTLSFMPESTSATASPIAVWPSWPQECITPGRVETKPSRAGRCAWVSFSRIGSASMSTRSAMVGPGAFPFSVATTRCGRRRMR